VAATRQYLPGIQPPDFEEHWASLLIAALWKYSKSLWKAQIEHVHGASIEDQASKMISDLQDNARHLYDQYDQHPSMILPRHGYLFTLKSLEQRLAMGYENLAARICSVEEAPLVMHHQDAALQRESSRYFPKAAPDPSTSGDSDYSPGSSIDLSTMGTLSTGTSSGIGNTDSNSTGIIDGVLCLDNCSTTSFHTSSSDSDRLLGVTSSLVPTSISWDMSTP